MGDILGSQGIRVNIVQSMGEVGKHFFPNFIQAFFENIDRRSRNEGSRGLIQVFHNPHRKGRPSPLAGAFTLKYLVGVLFKAPSSGREKKTNSDPHPKDP